MRIIPPPRFGHAGELRAHFDSADPREDDFSDPEYIVDLRDSEFVQIPAVLWCLVTLLLAKAKDCNCKLLVPTNLGVCIYLKSTGLFSILQQNGIEVDDRGIGDRLDYQLILALTRLDSEGDVEKVTNDAHEALKNSRLGSANLYPLVSEVFSELAMNGVQHSESPIGSYGMVQFYESAGRQRFVCSVADGGIGIRRSLTRNPEHEDKVAYDWSAIELAMRERVSGLLDKRRGIGLYGVAEDMKMPGRHLTIHSGIGSLQISEELEGPAQRTRLFPGTLASASFPT